MTFENNVVIIRNVTMSGSDKKFNFILDSGATYSCLSKDVADEINFTPTAQEIITDGYENETVQLGTLNVRLSSVEFENVGFTISNSKTLAILNVDGIIGYNLMRSCIWKLGINEIIITDKIKTVSELSDYHKQKLYAGPTVAAGFCQGFNSTMLFDLGDNGTVEIQESRIGLIKEKNIIVGQGSPFITGLGDGTNHYVSSNYKLLQVKGFVFGQDTVKNMIVHTANAPLLPVDVIGAGILNYYKIILDFPNKKIYTRNFLKSYKNKDFRSHGFKCDFVNDELVVTFIWKSSSAFNEGLKIGQKIKSINALNIEKLSDLEEYEKYDKLHAVLDEDMITLILMDTKGEITISNNPLFNADFTK